MTDLGRRAHPIAIAHHRHHQAHLVIAAVAAALQHPHQAIPHPTIRTVQSARKPKYIKMGIHPKQKNTPAKSDEPNANRLHQVPIRNKLPFLLAYLCSNVILSPGNHIIP